MIESLVQLIAQWIEFIWPARRVRPFERALYTIWGRWQWEVGPGIWPIIPWFCEVDPESIAVGTVQTPRIDITAQDGTMVTLQATANVQIVNLKLAVNSVDHYMESTQERLQAVVATRLSKIDAAKLAPEKRGPLLTELRKWVDQDTQKFGVYTSELSFSTFVVNARPFRLLGDNPNVSGW